MKLNSPFRSKNILLKKSLEEIDELYKTIVCTMSYSHRKEYCESLIFRTIKDLDCCQCKLKSIKLRQLLKATISELEKLQPK